MKKITAILFLAIIIAVPVIGQQSDGHIIKNITHPEQGQRLISQAGEQTSIATDFLAEGSTKDVDINWQFTDAVAVGSRVQVSSATGQTFMSWWLNNERVSLYEDSSTPVWEQFIETDWEWPIDLTEDGIWAAVGYDTAAQVYKNTTSSIFWEVIVEGTLIGVKLDPFGSKLFIARNYGGNAYVDAYAVGEDTPEWSSSFTGNGTVFTGSDDGSTMVLCQYSGVNKMWVINAENGETVFDAFYKNQNAPALSYDGRVILNGDYSGNVHVYEYDESISNYSKKWSYKVGGGGTSAWVVGMGVSGDGSTLAVGTLVFISGGGYDGEIYLFNSWSPVPLWIYENAGDEVASIDFTFDGSLMAAAGWGPLDHSKPDFWLFRKESSSAIFSINTMGSFNSVDISPEGTLCAVTGKAVHNREFGSGGLLYNVDSHPDGGNIAGTVSLENTNNNKNAKLTIEELEDYFAYSNTDGTYDLKYVPEGSYTITASKIGYYPVMIENVDVVEGETTTLDIDMQETGNPPYGLFATQGAGLSVNLSWNMDNTQDIEGFNIYRKYIEGDMFPEVPIATLSNSEFSFEDVDLIPLREYYYAVTAIIEEGVESPYSNINAGWMSDGFVTGDISVYVGSTPVIDGSISTGEWDDAFMLDASDFLGKYDNSPNPVGSVTMYFKSNADFSELYVACINENDSVLEDHDEVALYVDDNNDGSYPVPDDLSEGNYWAAYYASGNELKYRPIFNNGGVGDVIYLENPQLEVSDATGVIVYEFMIPMGAAEPWEINPNPNNESGIFSFVLDDPTAFDGYWPCWNPEIFIPLDYGQINFGAEDEVPPPPEDVNIWWVGEDEVNVILSWDQPEINDFNHFNVYYSAGGGVWELLDQTIGRQYIHTTGADYLEFRITTVDHAGQESEVSDIAIYDITIGVLENSANATTSIFPNPSSENVSISIALQNPGNYTLELINLQGELIRTLHSGHTPAGILTIQWDGNSISGIVVPAGIYLVKLQGEGIIHTNKLIRIND